MDYAGRRIHIRARRNKKRRRVDDSTLFLNDECVGKTLYMDKDAIGVPILLSMSLWMKHFTFSLNGTGNAFIKSNSASVSFMAYHMSFIESYKYDT